MADIADIANDHVLQQQEQRLAARKPAVVEISEECHQCGDPIPPARLVALAGQGCVHCIECQTILEAQRR
ncbi:hypothetical protein PKB_1268 [Pseudomonas knackmussii B13]|uniref:Zinc finger DksA/TraR C4-type domain-containing protein n=1 Tax=Pseudomonas knackmussii (strain DSM 6978 / CCUG 54928 / LMG 23759 / B13) TaxID=1301098 RepID=A0A024HDV9_PSEKB|nr:TraR/DksA C4-type zinc finger protein [Pseudomonas knackmussii]CDF82633.1 hypothetical protein PKB_1268 [Pseudomonas knackmussii B13]